MQWIDINKYLPGYTERYVVVKYKSTGDFIKEISMSYHRVVYWMDGKFLGLPEDVMVTHWSDLTDDNRGT